MSIGLRGLVRYLWKNRRLVIPGLLALIVSDGCQLVAPLVVKSGVDAVSAPGPDAADVIIRQAWLLLGLTVGTVVARFVWRHFLLSAARRAEMDLRERLLERALSLPVTHYSRTRTGEIMALATNDVSSVRMALAMGMVAGFDATAFAAVALVTLFVLNWKLALITAAPFPVLALVMAVALRMIYHRWDRVQSAFEDLTEKARESLSGMRVLRAYVQDEGDLRDFQRFNDACYHRQMEYVRVDALFHPVIMLLAGLSMAILLAFGGAQVARGEMSLGSFTAFSTYLGMLSWPMIAAGWVLTLVQRGAASMARIQEMLDQPSEPTLPEASQAFGGEIVAKNLGFAYPGAEGNALSEVSFQVPAGGSLGLVGEVGSGKTTLAFLLSRLYDPPPGTLFLDGIDVAALNLTQLRRQIAYVPQEAFLFSESISENLRLGDPDADLERLREVCRLAAVDDEIGEFPQGYETMLGERGVTLSGGQKQRLSLARALLKRAPVLVLDDTLSAVDAQAEERVLHGLQDRLEGRTAIVISHRVRSVRDLDQIIVLQKGRVVQRGTHAQLLAQPGYYREMYELQELEA